MATMFSINDILHQRYRLQKTLGKTAVGHQTWLAFDQNTKEQVTVKLLAFNPQMKWEELKLFEREAQILQALDHPFIPKYIDYFDIDKSLGEGIPWFGLVQTYIEGQSLQEMLDSDYHFREKEIKSIAQQILTILIYLHELCPPVLHRDIKPSNLILSRDNSIYLIDFGAVQSQASVTGVTFTIVGTGGYAPLEQFWGRAVPASDLYALGATLIHLLTGVCPLDLPQKNSRIYFEDKVTISPHFCHWLQGMTEIILEKRMSSAREALNYLNTPQKNLFSFSYSFLEKSKKPLSTIIEVVHKPDELGIYIPGRFKTRFPFSFFYSWDKSTAQTVLAIVLILGIWNPIAFMLILGLILFGAVGQDSANSIGDQYVNFTKQSIESYYKFWFFKYGTRKYFNASIKGIYLYNRNHINQVVVKTYQGIVFIGNRMTDDECEWLYQEIQTWLNNNC